MPRKSEKTRARTQRRRIKRKNGVTVKTVPKRRDYAAEYARRIARAISRGWTRSQARGHPKVDESTRSSRNRLPLDDWKLQRALKALRETRNIKAAAHEARISPERLRRVAKSRGAIKKRGRRWIVNPALPRRMPIYSRGRQIVITVGDLQSASQIGRYLNAVRYFRRSNDRKWLEPFVGQSVTDISDKAYPFETNPNSLYRLAVTGGETFEQIYRIVV